MKHGHGGAIVNVASNMGIAAVRNLSPYCASKGGVILLTKAMALDCGKYGIRINCICPGTILTPMTLGFFEASGDVEEMKTKYRKAIPLEKFGTSKDIAYSALYLISDESSFVTGSAIVIDGGRTAAAPGY